MKNLFLSGLYASVLMGLATPALAYVGPGAGITFFGALIGFFVTIFIVLFGLLAWPIKRMLNKKKAEAMEAEEKATQVAEQQQNQSHQA